MLSNVKGYTAEIARRKIFGTMPIMQYFIVVTKNTIDN